jgi:hypothetical protein
VRNFLSDIKGGTQTEDAEEDIWTEERQVGEDYIMRIFITCTLSQT